MSPLAFKYRRMMPVHSDPLYSVPLRIRYNSGIFSYLYFFPRCSLQAVYRLPPHTKLINCWKMLLDSRNIQNIRVRESLLSATTCDEILASSFAVPIEQLPVAFKVTPNLVVSFYPRAQWYRPWACSEPRSTSLPLYVHILLLCCSWPTNNRYEGDRRLLLLCVNYYHCGTTTTVVVVDDTTLTKNKWPIRNWLNHNFWSSTNV